MHFFTFRIQLEKDKILQTNFIFSAQKIMPNWKKRHKNYPSPFQRGLLEAIWTPWIHLYTMRTWGHKRVRVTVKNEFKFPYLEVWIFGEILLHVPKPTRIDEPENNSSEEIANEDGHQCEDGVHDGQFHQFLAEHRFPAQFTKANLLFQIVNISTNMKFFSNLLCSEYFIQIY